jgi:hypothetical protein
MMRLPADKNKMMKKERNASLLLCVVMDVIGYWTYSVPFIGEFADLLWAPISAAIFFKMFGGWKGAMGGVFNFIEELLPGTDFIPSFTLMWLWRNVGQRKQASNQQSVVRNPLIAKN